MARALTPAPEFGEWNAPATPERNREGHHAILHTVVAIGWAGSDGDTSGPVRVAHGGGTVSPSNKCRGITAPRQAKSRGCESPVKAGTMTNEFPAISSMEASSLADHACHDKESLLDGSGYKSGRRSCLDSPVNSATLTTLDAGICRHFATAPLVTPRSSASLARLPRPRRMIGRMSMAVAYPR